MMKLQITLTVNKGASAMKRNWLIEERKKKGFNQEQLGDVVGIGKTYVSQIEQGTKTPSGFIGLKLSKVLGFPMEKLYELEYEQK
jgi:putative transcriptional regulator